MFYENLDIFIPSILSKGRGNRNRFVQPLFSLQNDLCFLCVKEVSHDVRRTTLQLKLTMESCVLSQLRHIGVFLCVQGNPSSFPLVHLKKVITTLPFSTWVENDQVEEQSLTHMYITWHHGSSRNNPHIDRIWHKKKTRALHPYGKNLPNLLHTIHRSCWGFKAQHYELLIPHSHSRSAGLSCPT